MATATTIYKYKLEPDCDVQMPTGAKVLSVGCQGDELFLWAEVHPELAHENRNFEVWGTGHPIRVLPNGIQRQFVGTALNAWRCSGMACL